MAEPHADSWAAPWLHRLAILTVLAALPLVLLGATVTTKGYGMADPVWPTEPWYLLGISWWDQPIGYLVEHWHRLVGWTVGFLMLSLTLLAWATERRRRRWLCWLVTAAGFGVLLQGSLGGARVLLDRSHGQDLAIVHGIFGQMVLALLVSIAFCTSRGWSGPTEAVVPREETAGLRHWSLLLVLLVLTQLAFGAILRHNPQGTPISRQGHLLVAFAVVATGVWLAREVWERHAADRRLLNTMRLLGVLLGLQVLLGVEAWMAKFFGPGLVGAGGTLPRDLLRADVVRIAHVALGALILATAVVTVLEAYRRTAWAPSPTVVPEGRLEGAA